MGRMDEVSTLSHVMDSIYVYLRERSMMSQSDPTVPPVSALARLDGLITNWRAQASQAAKWAAEHEAKFDGANAHAFRKERRIWTTCAEELTAISTEVHAERTQQDEELKSWRRVAENLQAEVASLTTELEHWKTCEHCKKPLLSPGLCTNGQHEWEVGKEQMIAELTTERERLQADVARLTTEREAQDSHLHAVLTAQGQIAANLLECIARLTAEQARLLEKHQRDILEHNNYWHAKAVGSMEMVKALEAEQAQLRQELKEQDIEKDGLLDRIAAKSETASFYAEKARAAEDRATHLQGKYDALLHAMNDLMATFQVVEDRATRAEAKLTHVDKLLYDWSILEGPTSSKATTELALALMDLRRGDHGV